MEVNTTRDEQLELLKKIHRQSKLRTWACVAIAAIIAIAVVTILPMVSSVMPKLDSLLSELNGITATLSEIDFVGLTDSITELTVVGTESLSAASEELSAAMEGLNKIDFDALSEAIDNFNAVSNKMARLFGR